MLIHILVYIGHISQSVFQYYATNSTFNSIKIFS